MKSRKRKGETKEQKLARWIDGSAGEFCNREEAMKTADEQAGSSESFVLGGLRYEQAILPNCSYVVVESDPNGDNKVIL
jgi:hypothetical protein